MLRLAHTKKSMSVVADQHGSPTSAADLASALLLICEKVTRGADIEWGTYHYCGRGEASWAMFATQIYETAKKIGLLSETPEVIPISTHEYPTAAERPAFSVLDCGKIQKNFGIAPLLWQESLENMLKRLSHEKT